MNENRQALLIGMMIIAKILITRILLLSDKSGVVKFITEEMTLEKQKNFKIIASVIHYSLLRLL